MADKCNTVVCYLHKLTISATHIIFHSKHNISHINDAYKFRNIFSCITPLKCTLKHYCTQTIMHPNYFDCFYKRTVCKRYIFFCNTEDDNVNCNNTAGCKVIGTTEKQRSCSHLLCNYKNLYVNIKYMILPLIL